MNVTDELINNILPNSLNINTNIVETRLDGEHIEILTQRTIPLNTLDLTSNLTEHEYRVCDASGMDTISRWFHEQKGSIYSVDMNIFDALSSIEVKDHTLGSSFMMSDSIYFNFERTNHPSLMLQKCDRAEILNFIDTWNFSPDHHVDMQVARKQILEQNTSFFIYSIHKDGVVSRGYFSTNSTLSSICDHYENLDEEIKHTIDWTDAFKFIETCFKILAFTSVPYLKPTKLSNKMKKKARSKISGNYFKDKTPSFRVSSLPLLVQLRKDHQKKSSTKGSKLKNGRVGHLRFLQDECFTHKKGEWILVKPCLDEYGNLPKKHYKVRKAPKNCKQLDQIEVDK